MDSNSIVWLPALVLSMLVVIAFIPYVIWYGDGPWP